MEQIEDSALIAQILDGDHKAFAILVQRYSRYVYAQIARSVRLVDDVEDLGPNRICQSVRKSASTSQPRPF